MEGYIRLHGRKIKRGVGQQLRAKVLRLKIARIVCYILDALIFVGVAFGVVGTMFSSRPVLWENTYGLPVRTYEALGGSIGIAVAGFIW